MGANATSASRSRTPSAEVLARESKVLELRQQNWSFTKIAAHPEVNLSDRGAAHKAFTRALERVHAEPAAEVRQLESTRIDRIGEILWAILLDDEKPIETRLKVVDRIIRLMERRAKLLGLDHEHGIAERALALEADRVRLIAVALGRALDALELSAEQRATAQRIVIAELRAADQADDDLDGGEPVHVITDVDEPTESRDNDADSGAH